MAAKLPFRARIAQAILGTRIKELIPALTPDGGLSFGPGGGRINDYSSKLDQLTANVGWCFTANNAIVEPAAAVERKLYRRKRRGNGREEIQQHQILEYAGKVRGTTGQPSPASHTDEANWAIVMSCKKRKI